MEKKIMAVLNQLLEGQKKIDELVEGQKRIEAKVDENTQILRALEHK